MKGVGQGKGGGRPPIEWDYGELKAMFSIGATWQEVADYFSCSTETVRAHLDPDNHRFDERFYAAYKNGQAHEKMSIRRSLHLLKKKSAAAAIFLAKNRCGMRDVASRDDELTIKIVDFCAAAESTPNDTPQEAL